ncbi:hypothetical protein [Cellulomonas endophytica]|uniref:hypothetical protein n=1 Tax=Cellulomonas endophytica TaxID=2494735 RepID=UPI0010111652|nr:hypothetical protein [Cellulomonas endophytica]
MSTLALTGVRTTATTVHDLLDHVYRDPAPTPGSTAASRARFAAYLLAAGTTAVAAPLAVLAALAGVVRLL